MAIQIGQKPSPTYGQPLELLSDCHRRVENFLRTLILVVEQANGTKLNALQREGLETALRYFREAAPKHTADEEESLFPRMRDADTEVAREALQRIAELEADHETAHQDHDLVERLGQKWLATDCLSSLETSEMRNALARLQSIYQRHIAIEDNEIFPLAGKVLNAEKLRSVGEEMAARRGQVWPKKSQTASSASIHDRSSN